MVSGRRSCKNMPDVFCHICGEYNVVHNRNPVTSFIKRAYHAYFGMKMGDQEKAWAPHMAGKTCTRVSSSVDQGQEEFFEVWNSHG